MSNTEFYTSIGLSAIAFYVLPVVLFFYLKHLYKKYKKPKVVLSEAETKEIDKIKTLELLLKDKNTL